MIPFRDLFGACSFLALVYQWIPSVQVAQCGWLLAPPLLSLFAVIVAGQLAGRYAGLSAATSLNVALTLLGRGEFSIIVAKLA